MKMFLIIVSCIIVFLYSCASDIEKIEIEPSEYRFVTPECLKIDEIFNVIGYDGSGKRQNLKKIEWTSDDPDIAVITIEENSYYKGTRYEKLELVCPSSMGRTKIRARYEDKETYADIVVYHEVQRKYPLGGNVSSLALGFDGTVYASLEGNLFAFTPDLKLLWKFNSDEYCDIQPPVIAPNDNVLFICGIYLYILDNKGSIVNKVTLDSFSYLDYGTCYYLGMPAVDYDGTIYITTNEGILYAFNPDGNFKWQFSIGYKYPNSPIVGLNSDIYFIAGQFSEKLYSVKSNGNLNWITNLGESISLYSPVIDFDGSIIVISLGGTISAIDPDGSTKWNYVLSAYDSFLCSSPVIGNNTIYVTSDTSVYSLGRLYTVDSSTRSIKWIYDGYALINSPSPIIDANGNIIVAGGYEYYVVDKNGTLVDKYLGNYIWEPSLVPLLLTDSIMYIKDNKDSIRVGINPSNFLYAIEATSPLATAPWPKFRKDNQNSGRY